MRRAIRFVLAILFTGATVVGLIGEAAAVEQKFTEWQNHSAVAVLIPRNGIDRIRSSFERVQGGDPVCPGGMGGCGGTCDPGGGQAKTDCSRIAVPCYGGRTATGYRFCNCVPTRKCQ